MPVLDFKEIPEAHKATGFQDTFELFARDFLSLIGYKIISHPNRGADGGADLIVEEKRTGVGGETIVKWLVSCKHKAHSGSSVNPSEESNIYDRVSAKKCDGFIGFYSTIPSSGLSSILEGIKDRIEINIYDRERIEKKLLYSTRGLEVAERYFPISLTAWKTNNPKPAGIFSDEPSLKCKICSKELLDKESKGIITFWKRRRSDYEKEPEYFEHIFWTCKGDCDRTLSQCIRSEKKELRDGWEDIADVMIPTVFIKWMISIINQLHSGTIYSDEAFDQLKEFFLNIYPFACRHLTDRENERVQSLMMMPGFLGWALG